VDEDWLDETLRGVPLYLEMASGQRRYSLTTEGVRAKLVRPHERGNVINVNLLWDSLPKTIPNLPTRHVVPRHPNSDHKGDPVVILRGPLKATIGTVHDVVGEDIFFLALPEKTKSRRAKRSEPTKHSMFDLGLCQWPSKKKI
jgi:hypothetical protein